MAPQDRSSHPLAWSIRGAQHKGRSGLVWRGRGRARRWAKTMASVGVRKRVSARTGRVTYQVWWLLDDGSQGAETVGSKDEARDLVAQKRLGVTRGAWQGPQRGRLPFSWWAEQWWEIWAADPDRSPTTLAVTESRLRLYVRPWFGERPIKRIGPADIRRWQAHLASSTGHPTLMQCRSLVLRILQFAVDEGAIDTNPVRRVPSPRRRADPEHVLDQAKRRALIPEEAGRLLACFPLFWWDHVLCLLGTGLRFGELAGLRRRRVRLDRPLPVLQVVDTRYQAGRFGSGFKPRPKSDAGIREVPLAPLVVEAIRRQLPPGSDPSDLVFTGPGGGPGHGGAGVPKGARTVLSRHNFHRTYQAALAKLADPTGELRPTAARVLKTLRTSGSQTTDQLTAALANHGRAIRPTTLQVALEELVAAELVAGASEGRPAAVAGVADGPRPAAGGRGSARRPRLPAYLRDLAGGRRHPGPGDRRADGPRGHRPERAAARQRHGRPLPAHHPGDGRPGRRSHSATTDDRAPCGRRVA
jgi:integrase